MKNKTYMSTLDPAIMYFNSGKQTKGKSEQTLSAQTIKE